MSGVELVYWNPRHGLASRRGFSWLPIGRRVGNFGDLLGPLLVAGILDRAGLDLSRPTRPARLLSVGSIVHLARRGDTIWGAGVNGHWLDDGCRDALDIRALRGPRTRDFILNCSQNRPPQIYGDPGLLLGWLCPGLVNRAPATEVTLVSNINEPSGWLEADQIPGSTVLDPRKSLEHCLATIAASEFVVGTSLHALIVADSLGIGTRPVRSVGEKPFKYEDYYAATGRIYEPAESVADARRLGPIGPPVWKPERLLYAFPWDLWTKQAPDSMLRLLGFPSGFQGL